MSVTPATARPEGKAQVSHPVDDSYFLRKPSRPSIPPDNKAPATARMQSSFSTAHQVPVERDPAATANLDEHTAPATGAAVATLPDSRLGK